MPWRRRQPKKRDADKRLGFQRLKSRNRHRQLGGGDNDDDDDNDAVENRRGESGVGGNSIFLTDWDTRKRNLCCRYRRPKRRCRRRRCHLPALAKRTPVRRAPEKTPVAEQKDSGKKSFCCCCCGGCCCFFWLLLLFWLLWLLMLFLSRYFSLKIAFL